MMHRARALASKSKVSSKHGAVVVKGSRVLGTGVNTHKTSPTWGGGPLGTVHAEAAAIRSAVNKGIDLRGSTIYVARDNPCSQYSRPCKSCQALIRKYGIRKVLYTDADGTIVSEWP